MVETTSHWTDTHCHLEDDRYRPREASDRGTSDRRSEDLGGTQGVLQRAREAGVGTFVTVGCDRESSLFAIQCARENDDVWATVGLHPHEAVNGVGSIADLFDEPRVIAVGEAGLDYYYEHSPRDAQRAAFADQIQIAHQRQLPLVIHTRDAWDETFDILRAESVPERVIFHCFTGGPDEARRCLDLGAFLSFSGIVTFKNAIDVAEAARMCPNDRVLVETDSPYLAPVPHRGRTNQPAHVADVGRFVADLRLSATADFAALTTANARIAFPGLAS
jgi:TatD DNase family protein